MGCDQSLGQDRDSTEKADGYLSKGRVGLDLEQDLLDEHAIMLHIESFHAGVGLGGLDLRRFLVDVLEKFDQTTFGSMISATAGTSSRLMKTDPERPRARDP